MMIRKMDANKTLPSTIVVDGKLMSFPNSPASPNNKTAVCIWNRFLVLPDIDFFVVFSGTNVYKILF